jgi:hypothetical protein
LLWVAGCGTRGHSFDYTVCDELVHTLVVELFTWTHAVGEWAVPSSDELPMASPGVQVSWHGGRTYCARRAGLQNVVCNDFETSNLDIRCPDRAPPVDGE